MGFDLVFGFLLLFFAWRGYKRGFVQQLLNWAGLVFGFLFAGTLSEHALPIVGPKLTYFPEDLRGSVVYLLAIIAIWLLVFTAGSMNLMVYRRRVYGINEPSIPDRMLGVGMGVAQAGVLVSILVFCWVYVPSAIRGNETVESAYKSSKAIEIVDEYRVIERIIDTEEVQRAWGHVKQIAEHYRAPRDTPRNADARELRLSL